MAEQAKPEVAPYRSGKDTLKLPVTAELPAALVERVLAALLRKRAHADDT